MDLSGEVISGGAAAAGVGNTWTFEKADFLLRNSQLSSKSACVSPGKPQMQSVVKLTGRSP